MNNILHRLHTRIKTLGTNVYKVVFGVAFSLLWARVMYAIWEQPSYLTFIWFYLGVGSLLLKWVFFEIIDRIRIRVTMKSVQKELEEADTRVEKSIADIEEETETSQPPEVQPPGLYEMMVRVEGEVLSMATMVESAVRRSMDSLQHKDIELAHAVVQEEQKIDQKEFDIRYNCMEVIEKGPLGRKNLYRIIATLGVITELERIGDYAEGIAKISLMIGDEPVLKLPKNIVEMTDKGLSMLRVSVQSFIESDVDEAQHICQMDNEIDTLYSDTFCELILMMVQESNTITRATRLVWVAHNLERLADRVTNICEWTPYSTTGEKRHIGSSSY